MKRDNRFRWVLVVFFIVIAAWYLYPTIEYYNLSEEELSDPTFAAEKLDLELKAVKLGLDLQGGINIQMEINPASLVSNLATNKDEVFDEIVRETENLTQRNNQTFLNNLASVVVSRNMGLERYYDRERRLDENGNVLEVMDYLQNQLDDGVQQSLNILRNRIDQFGVAEPNIYKQGSRRIVVELPGTADIELAKSLIGQTAKLEFRLEKSAAVYQEVIASLNRVLRNEPVDSISVEQETADSTEVEKKPSTATEIDVADLFNQPDSAAAEQDSAQKAIVDLNTFEERPFDALLTNIGGERVGVNEQNVPIINAILDRPEVRRAILDDAEFMWSAEPETINNVNYYVLYLLNKDAVLGGEVITDARVTIGTGYDQASAGRPTINMDMNREGARTWSYVTGANIGNRIDIVLDGKVISDPVVESKIPNGKSVITGSFSMDEAKNLMINLKSGSFTADMDIIAEQAVGPSLGVDSIRKGTYSAIIGLIMVITFIVLYYRFSGMIATLALVLNLYFVMAVLAGFHATLTLPGIAGLILTIGMAVDANVLIFERIREELLTGKTIRAAIDSGYSRAFFTILDANITTLITAVILYQYGTGPIKGFALTLSIGIVTSMFTAIIVTRLIFDLATGRKEIMRLSI
ncbi:protein translocase subunit SecD [candidate division KSB1 bacterium]